MIRGNTNDFFFPDWLNGCQGYLLDNKCYASLAVQLIQSPQCSLSYSRRLMSCMREPDFNFLYDFEQLISAQFCCQGGRNRRLCEHVQGTVKQRQETFF